MYHTRTSLYDRSLEKTPEQVFVNSLRKEFELSPAESAGEKPSSKINCENFPGWQKLPLAELEKMLESFVQNKS